MMKKRFLICVVGFGGSIRARKGAHPLSALALSFALLCLSLFVSTAQAKPEVIDRYTTKHYEKDSGFKKLLFEEKAEKTKEGEKEVLDRIFHYPGEVENIAVKEKAIFEKGQLIFYEIYQKQLGETWTMKVQDKRVHFEKRWDGKDKVEKDDEKLTKDFIASPTVILHLKKNFKKIMDGETIRFRLGVGVRKETIGFKFYKLREEKFQGEDVVVVKMRPSTLFIAALVDPLLFYVKKDGSDVLRLIGRTLPRVKKDGKWEEVDTDLLFFHEL